jgi:hypothetical protein
VADVLGTGQYLLTNTRHLISLNGTLDGNFKANLFYKRDDGSDEALTDGMMYFPRQKEWEALAKTYIVREEDKVKMCFRWPSSPLMASPRKYHVRRILGPFVTRDQSSTGIQQSVV